ncbi:MAG: hypothetical protein JO058_20495, partial [Alphaproteobacteria bacterium]|nr:hypothetical protein [Alphaproteobacteria bacterium]
IDHNLSPIAVGGQPEFVSINDLIRLESDRVGPQPDPTIGQEFHPRRFQGALHHKQARFARQTAAGLKIAQHAQPDPSRGGQISLGPIEETARGAGGRSTEDHDDKLVWQDPLVNILSF